MWDLIRNDPVLKTISIFIVGVFAFAFAFSIMFGAGQTNMEHGTNTAAGYNAATGLGHIIVLLSKILIIILLITIIIVIVKCIKKYVIGNEPIKGLDSLKNKPISAILMIVGGMLLLLLTINMLAPSSNPGEMAHSFSNGRTSNFGYGITGFLYQLLKLVAVFFLIGLITGLVMYFKDRYFSSINKTLQVAKKNCLICGSELKENWKCCPSCGTEKKQNEVAKLVEDNGTKQT